MKEYFGHACRKKDKNGEYIRDQWNAFQTVSGYKSAIKDYYKDNRIDMGVDVSAMCDEFFAGYKRKIASLKQRGEMSLVEGKRPITFSGYNYIAKKSLKDSVDYKLSIFSHAFVVMCWNLIARIVSVGNLMYNHISWDLDSLIVHIPTHKGNSFRNLFTVHIIYIHVGDEEGNNSYPKHIYANACNPEICPILSLAIHVYRFYPGTYLKAKVEISMSAVLLQAWR